MSVGQGAYQLADGAAGLEVQPAMKMVGTYLAEVTGEGDGEIKRRDEGGLACIGFLGIAALHTTDKKQEKEKQRIFHILYSQYYLIHANIGRLHGLSLIFPGELHETL